MVEVIVALCLGFIQYAEHSRLFRGFLDCWAYLWRHIRGRRAIDIFPRLVERWKESWCGRPREQSALGFSADASSLVMPVTTCHIQRDVLAQCRRWVADIDGWKREICDEIENLIAKKSNISNVRTMLGPYIPKFPSLNPSHR